MAELRRLRGYSETLLQGLSRQRNLDGALPENLQGQPIEIPVSNVDDPSIFGAQQSEGDGGNDNKELIMYLAIIAMVFALLLCTCVVVTMIIRSTLQKKVHVKHSPTRDATDSLPQDSASSVMDSAASQSTATGGKSALQIPLPAALVGSGRVRRIPKDLSVAVLQNNAMPPRTPLEMPPERNPGKGKHVKQDGVDVSPPSRQYSPSMRLLLEQVETLSDKPGQVLPLSSEQNGTSGRRVDSVNLTEL